MRNLTPKTIMGSCKVCTIVFSYEYTAGIKKWYCSELCTMKKNYERHVIRKENECWQWSGIVNIYGYGVVRTGKVNGIVKYITAHRASWIIHNGKIPDNMHILHRCDTPSCTSLECLFLGTHQENMKDRDKKGRLKGQWQKGRVGPNKKFTSEQESEARSLFGVIPMWKIAEKLHLHPSTIARFKSKYNKEQS